MKGQTSRVCNWSAAAWRCAGLEAGDDILDLSGLPLSLFNGSVGLFHQCCIVLRHLVDLAHCDGNLFNGRGLLTAVSGNAIDQSRICLDAGENRFQLSRGFGNQTRSGPHLKC